MVRRRVLDPEQVVEHGPDVALRVPRLALADVRITTRVGPSSSSDG
jgi:hypothetical protein